MRRIVRLYPISTTCRGSDISLIPLSIFDERDILDVIEREEFAARFGRVFKSFFLCGTFHFSLKNTTQFLPAASEKESHLAYRSSVVRDTELSRILPYLRIELHPRLVVFTLRANRFRCVKEGKDAADESETLA